MKRSSAKLPPGVTWESAASGLRSGLRQGEAGAWESGFYWNQLRQMFRKRRTTARQVLRKEVEAHGIVPPSPAEMSRRGAVAGVFSKEATVRFGSIIRLYELLVYFRWTGKTDFSLDDPGREIVEVPQQDGSVVKKAAAECTLEELVRANSKFGGGDERAGLDPQDVALQKLGQMALASAVGSGGKSSLRLSREKGELFISVSFRMPLARLSSLVDALKRLIKGFW